ncbi:hypothetical protein [Streptomyces nigrescens]|uniref:hypothetical protein n=1 Tax=Streptomyces nigrescens TaxID=1920 RepID=UPI0037029E43
MTALITPNPDGYLSIPDRAARYMIEHKIINEMDGWQVLEDIAMPDGALSGVNAERAASIFLAAADGIAVLDEDVLTISADELSIRFAPVKGWERLTPSYRLAARYTVEGTHIGRGTWTTKGIKKPEASRSEARHLTNSVLEGIGDVSVHPSGVLIVEGGAVDLALRLTPITEPSRPQEQWTPARLPRTCAGS